MYKLRDSGKLSRLSSLQNGFSIEAIRSSRRFSFRHCSYLISWHGKKIYISGDAESKDLETVRQLKGLDWAFINPWLFVAAQREEIKIDSKMLGVYHLYPKQKVEGEAPENIFFLKNEEKGRIWRTPY